MFEDGTPSLLLSVAQLREKRAGPGRCGKAKHCLSVIDDKFHRTGTWGGCLLNIMERVRAALFSGQWEFGGSAWSVRGETGQERLSHWSSY